MTNMLVRVEFSVKLAWKPSTVANSMFWIWLELKSEIIWLRNSSSWDLYGVKTAILLFKVRGNFVIRPTQNKKDFLLKRARACSNILWFMFPDLSQICFVCHFSFLHSGVGITKFMLDVLWSWVWVDSRKNEVLQFFAFNGLCFPFLFKLTVCLC